MTHSVGDAASERGADDLAWRLDQGALAREVVDLFQSAGLVEGSRSRPSEWLEGWFNSLSDQIREKLCDRWRDGRKSDVTAIELAASIADVLSVVHQDVPFATASVYFVRFMGQRFCRV